MEKWQEAHIDRQKGMKYKDIAEKYNVKISTVKSWANRHWKNHGCNPKEKEVATKGEKVATLPHGEDAPTEPKPKGKRGAPKGNKNAVGKKTGAPKGNQNNLKHGIYANVYWSTLTEDERMMIDDMSFDEEHQLLDQIRLLRVRELRHLKMVDEYKNKVGGLSIDTVTKRLLKTFEDEVDGKVIEDETTTKTVATFDIITKLEAELTKIQKQLSTAVTALHTLRQARMANEQQEESGLVDDWIAGVMKGDDIE